MSRNKRDKGNRKSTKSSRSQFTVFEHPFAHVPQETLVHGMVEIGRSYEKEYNEVLNQLDSLLREIDPLHLLSVLSVYGLFVGIDDAGKVSKKETTERITQAHVELVHALVLRIPFDEISGHPAVPEKVQNIWDALLSLGRAFSFKRLIQIEAASSDAERSLLELQERLRNHTHFVRNWGHFKQTIDIAKRLHSTLDVIYDDAVGLSATELIEMFEFLVSRMEVAISDHWQLLRRVFQAETVEQVATAYYNTFPDLKGTPESLASYINSHGATRENALFVILAHSDLRLIEKFSFSISEIADKTALSRDKLRQALPRLGYKFGDLKNENTEYFFLANPVWTKPLIHISDDSYFCAVPQMFFSFVLQTLSGFLKTADAQNAYAQRRAQFLEEEVASLFKKAFPGSASARNVRWREADTQFESDLIVKVDSYLLIVEAKSGSISSPALRGALNRVERHIKDLIIEPAIQSQRLANKLKSSLSSSASELTELSQQISLDLSNVKKIIRLSVTLEDFATIQSSIATIKNTNWFPDGVEIPPTVSLADLQTILDILPDIPERTHYFARRAELQGKMRYRGDELDLLGLYLKTGFNLGNTEFTHNWVVTGTSEKIDEYYNAKDHGIARDKPSLKETKWWRDIRHQIQFKQPERWLEVAVELLHVSYEDQCKLQKALKKLAKTVKKNWRRPGHTNSMILLPPKGHDTAYGLLVFRQRNYDKRHEFIRNIASQVFNESHVQRCIIIGINIDQKHYPYSTMACLDRPT